MMQVGVQVVVALEGLGRGELEARKRVVGVAKGMQKRLGVVVAKGADAVEWGVAERAVPDQNKT